MTDGERFAKDQSVMPTQNQEMTVGVEAGHSSQIPGTGGDPIEKQTSLAVEAWRELRRNPLFVVSAAVVLVMVFFALFPQVIAPVQPILSGCEGLTKARQPPQAGAPFGYDGLGCDIFDAVIWGARPSIAIGVLTSIGIVTIGVVVGSLAGFYGGWIDAVLSRLTDVMFGLPFLVGAIVLLSAFPNRTLWHVTLVLIILSWASLTRIMRSSVFSARNQDYVQAARALGASNGRIIFRHILPNAITPVLVLATIGVGSIITGEAVLTYLGVGLKAPSNSWGLSISDAEQRLQQAPHMLLFPSLFLSITVLAFIVMGDAVRDAFDPKLR